MIVAPSPLTYKDLLNAKRALEKNTLVIDNRVVLVSKKIFRDLYIRAKYYSGKQIIKRNHYAKNKKLRYRRIGIVPHMSIVNKNTIESYGIKIIKTSQSHQ